MAATLYSPKIVGPAFESLSYALRIQPAGWTSFGANIVAGTDGIVQRGGTTEGAWDHGAISTDALTGDFCLTGILNMGSGGTDGVVFGVGPVGGNAVGDVALNATNYPVGFWFAQVGNLYLGFQGSAVNTPVPGTQRPGERLGICRIGSAVYFLREHATDRNVLVPVLKDPVGSAASFRVKAALLRFGNNITNITIYS